MHGSGGGCTRPVYFVEVVVLNLDRLSFLIIILALTYTDMTDKPIICV